MYDLKDIEIIGKYGEKYPAKLQEVNTDYIKVLYRDVPEAACLVPVTDVCYAPSQNQSWQMSNLPELIAGTLVDVFLPSDSLPFYNESLENIKPKAWWPAVVKKKQGELIVVELLDLGSSDYMDINSDKVKTLRKEIVEVDLARLRCESVAFSKHPLKSFRIEIPDDVRKCFIDDKYESDLKRWCGDPVTFTKADNNSYILVMSTDDTPIYKAKLLCKKWVQQWSAKYELTQQLEGSRYQMQTIYEDEFYVDQKLLGFALGADYSNLKLVSQLSDVISAQLIDPSGKFRVVAKTEDALQMAREKLEIQEEFVEFDKKHLGILLSENGRFLNQIIQLTNLFRLMVIGDDIEERLLSIDSTYQNNSDTKPAMSDDAIVVLSLTGSQNAVNRTKELLSFAADNLCNLMEVRQHMVDIDNELLNDIRAHNNNRIHDVSKRNTGVSLENGIENMKINGHIKSTKSAWKD